MIHEPLTVLLIEDTRDDEQLALRALRGCGLPLLVRVARDGEKALQSMGLDGAGANPHRRLPDLIISDYKMPKLSGDQVLAQARASEALRDIPYVMLSSSDDRSDVARCLALGASAYVVKPVDFTEYIECVRRITQRWLDPSVDRPAPFCVLAENEAVA